MQRLYPVVHVPSLSRIALWRECVGSIVVVQQLVSKRLNARLKERREGKVEEIDLEKQTTEKEKGYVASILCPRSEY